MTSFDFVVTLATGSLLATAAAWTSWPPFLQAIIAIAPVLGIQFILAVIRKSFGLAGRIIANEPLLLMRDGEFIDAALASSRVSRSDVLAKLRQANVHVIGEGARLSRKRRGIYP